MNTLMINDKRENLTFRSSTGMYTTLSHSGCSVGQYGADIYNVDDVDHIIVIVPTNANGAYMHKFTIVIDKSDFDAIKDLHDPYNDMIFHMAIMTKLGFN